MTDPDKAADATRIAIEFLTLWMESDRRSAMEHIARVIYDPEGEDPILAVVGLLNLSMFMGFLLAKERGVEEDEYEAWVGRFLQDVSPRLPDFPT